MHAPPDSETTFNLEAFVDGHRATFPGVVRVAEGFWADSAEETLENGQVLLLHEVQQEHFVVVTRTDGVDLCIPRKCPVKVELVPLDRLNDEYSTVEELAQLEYFRVLDDMPSFHIKGGTVMKINQARQDDGNHLGCEPLSHDGPQEVVNLPFTEQGRFQPLHNGMEYFLEEVIEQYPLPSKVGVRLVNDFRLPLKSTLPWGVGLRLQKDFQDETIIATAVGGEGEGDVLLFPKTLDLTVIPDLNRAVRNGEELTESCQLARMSSVHRVALLSAVRAFSVKSPVRRFNLECLTPPPLTKPCKSEAVPRTDSFNPRNTNKTLDADGMTSANSCHPSLRQTDIVENSSRASENQSALLGSPLPGGTNQTFNSDPEIVPMGPEMAQTETANDSSITPALPKKKNEYGAGGQTLPCGNRNTPFHSRQGTSIHRTVKPKQKLKPTDQAQFGFCEDVASANTSSFTPPLPRKQNDTRGLTLPNTVKREDYNLKKQICYRIGPGETKKEAILSTSQTMTQQPIHKPRKSTSSTYPFATENNRYPIAPLVLTNVSKSMDGQDVNASQTSISGTDPGSEPPQTNLASQTSRLSDINVNSQTHEVEATKERLTLGISAPFVTIMERTLHHCCTKKLGPGSAQHRESSQNQAEQDFLSRGNTVSSDSIMCSSTSVGAQVSSDVILNESVFDVASSQWTHPFKELVSLPNCAERGRELIPCRLRQVYPHYVNHSPVSQTLPTNGAGTTLALKPPSPPYVNCDQRSFQFRNEDSAIRIQKSATPGNPHFQMDGDNCRRPIPDSTLKSPSPPYVNYDPRPFQLRNEDSANRFKKSATLKHTHFQMDGDNRTRPIPGSALKSLSPSYVNYDPRSFQFRNEDSANVVKKLATLGHFHFQMDGSNCARPIPDSALKSLAFPYVNCNPRSSQFRNDDSANRIEKSATPGHSHFQMDEDRSQRPRPNPDSSKLPGAFRDIHASLKDKQGPDDSSSYRRILPGPKNGIDSTLPFENGEDDNVHNGCTTVHYGGTLQQPNKALQRKIDQGTQTDGMSCPDQAQSNLFPSTLIRGDLNRDFEDLHVLNLYIDMRAQLNLQQEQHDAEVHLLKAEIVRLAAELKRIQNLDKNVRQKYTKGCQTVNGTVQSKDSGAIRASTVPKPESVSVRTNCHTYENDPRLNGRNATTQNARSVIYRTTTTAENSRESHQSEPKRTRNLFPCHEP